MWNKLNLGNTALYCPPLFGGSKGVFGIVIILKSILHGLSGAEVLDPRLNFNLSKCPQITRQRFQEVGLEGK
jgi:hypothetical protein